MLKDFYTTRPDELKPGDVLVCTVTLHILHHTKKGKPVYRVYRCAHEGDDIPQGSAIFTNPQQIAEGLFPVVKGILVSDH